MLPLAIPGMVTGIILTAGRIFGEAAALLFTAGVSTPTAYNFTNFNLSDPQLAMQSMPPGDDALGLHLEAQLRGPRAVLAPDRRRLGRGPRDHGAGLQPRLRAPLVALLQRRVGGVA